MRLRNDSFKTNRLNESIQGNDSNAVLRASCNDAHQTVGCSFGLCCDMEGVDTWRTSLMAFNERGKKTLCRSFVFSGVSRPE